MQDRNLPALASYLEAIAHKGFAAKTVIDVGACYGTLELLGSFPDAYHIFIEPQPQMQEGLRRWGEVMDSELHEVALSDHEGEAQIALNGASTSLLYEGEHIVRVSTLDMLIGNRQLGRPTILKTDCQGKDLAVLRGAAATLSQIDLIICETSLIPPAGLRAEGLFHDMVALLTEHGFLLHDIVGHHIRPSDGSLAQLDLAFVREGHWLLSTKSWR